MLSYTRADLKHAAKDSLRGRWGTAIGAMLLAAVVPALVFSVFEGIMNYFVTTTALNGADGISSVISLLLGSASIFFAVFIAGPLTIGLSFFDLRFVRGMEVTATMPYNCFRKDCLCRFALAYVMMNLFIALWSLLLIIPGIVKSFSYAMMPYILMDHPEMGWREAIKESKIMMKGHKGDLFVLYLSFLLWILLCCITFGIAILYVGPYMEMTMANFYRSLKNERIDAVTME